MAGVKKRQAIISAMRNVALMDRHDDQYLDEAAAIGLVEFKNGAVRLTRAGRFVFDLLYDMAGGIGDE